MPSAYGQGLGHEKVIGLHASQLRVAALMRTTLAAHWVRGHHLIVVIWLANSRSP
jgi:hypothetical protein